jgi:hypothetical protein
VSFDVWWWSFGRPSSFVMVKVVMLLLKGNVGVVYHARKLYCETKPKNDSYVWYIRHFSCFCGVSVVFRLVSYQDRPHVDILGGDLIEPSVSVKIRVGPASQKRRKSLELPGCTTCFQVLVLESPPKFAVIASTTVVTDYY